MKVNKKRIGWIIGLVCVLILVVLMLRMCGSGPNEVIDETNQTEESTNLAEETETTVETTEATEETTEATEETEETTEPTEATTIPSAPPTSSAIGSPGSVGTPEEEEETTAPTEPEEVVIIPAGQDTNPYAEVVREYPAGFESVSVPGKGVVTYAVFVHDGAELTIESADAYVIHGGKTYESAEGVVKLLLTAENGGPAIFQLGNKAPGEKAFQLSFIDALGEPTNPQILEKIDEVKVELKEDDKTGYTLQWTAQEEGNVTFNVAQITENVKCDVILTVGEMTVHLVEAEQEDKENAEKPSEPAKDKTEVSIGISKGDVLTIQVITLMPEKEVQKPAEGETTEPADPTEPVQEKLPAASITLKGSFVAGENKDKLEQEETKPTEPEQTQPTDPSETTKPTDPANPSDPSGSTDPSDPTQPSTPSEPVKPVYSVTVTDYNGNPKTGVVVQFLKDGALVAMIPVDSNGVATADFENGSYTAKLLFSGEELYYEEKDAVLIESASQITLKVAPKVSGTPESINDADAYNVGVGGTYTQLQSDVVNYFIFTPTVPGNYQVTTSDPEAQISYWGGNPFFVYDATASMDLKDNAYTLNVKEGNIGEDQGVTHIIGITGASDCILVITRLGDPILDETDFPVTVYKEGTVIEQYVNDELKTGMTKKYVELTGSTDSIKIVLSENDGYYHVGDANGPILYMDLSSTAPHVPLYGMMGMANIGGQNILQHFYDDEGTLIRRESYNYLLKQYASNVDKTYGVYPLTEDLKYMIQQAGSRNGWWDKESPDYMFTDVSGLNTEIAWMFACCTIE